MLRSDFKVINDPLGKAFAHFCHTQETRERDWVCGSSAATTDLILVHTR